MYIIAEIGINHNGDLDTALQMIAEAKRAGADCVKFQKRNPDKCVPDKQKNILRVFKGQRMTYLEYKKLIEFGEKEYDEIRDFCKRLDINWTVSVWDVDSVEFMRKYSADIPFIKVPSACITDKELIKAVNNLGVSVVMSDGMSSVEEIIQAADSFQNLSCILHCNSSYPCAEDELDLNVIETYLMKFPNTLIGYSGHEIGYFPTLIATACKAQVIERHFTLDNNMEGTDQKASLNPEDFKKMVEEVKRVETILGKYVPQIYPSELVIRDKLRNS